MKKICVVTGTRAEYGLLRPLIERIRKDKNIKLQLIATGMHLSPEFDCTYKEINKDGYDIDEKIEILLSSDTSIGISKSMGLAMISFSEAYERLKPDIIVVLGDRYEIFAAVSTAYIAKIPVAHLYGGETTQGAFDEGFRHSITKMSYLHFTSTKEYRKRVIQLGEHPDRVFTVGAMGIENIKKLKLFSKEELEKTIGFKFGKRTALVTFHSTTLDESYNFHHMKNLLDALDEIENLKIIFTGSNSDTDGRMMNQLIQKYASENSHKAIYFINMGYLRYLSAMKYSDVVVGNSSSGLVEAPYFSVPTVNIGDRQRGRIQGCSIINCNPSKNCIITSILKALSSNFRKELINKDNPYGDGNVSEKVMNILKDYLKMEIQIKKSFYDIKISL
ncbi:UDP-N-acetylglucosamine 2-epimerase [Inediibacterium massiliense]|uniref:UDP-N-acetylglucosamine 2-epimerase n=1 Tax=Inediibacterium massiliense TaxID=1658111 RepID=UPI0006B5C771|nr:UDP-N-acetylglucosamine 2-epimerase [Inediibacterium massiliense]